jgi:hypothetical protein
MRCRRPAVFDRPRSELSVRVAPLCVWRASSGFHRDVARSTAKNDAVLRLNNPKAIGKTLDANVLVAIVVCLTARLRKLRAASLAAFRTSQIFNPLITFGHPANMRSGPCVFQAGSLPQSNIPTTSGRRPLETCRDEGLALRMAD